MLELKQSTLMSNLVNFRTMLRDGKLVKAMVVENYFLGNRCSVVEEKRYVLVDKGGRVVFEISEGQRNSCKPIEYGVFWRKGEREDGIKRNRVLKRLKSGDKTPLYGKCGVLWGSATWGNKKKRWKS